ncbi:ABC transporter ATP-binding protein [Pseudonocardia sp. TRM90224]|uniref:ABC transporter ATP-binding protein n=1 Tax=Pseudonocardia sp. TRM90224 TaxID=2812678 RepID=UPI001E3330E9|nr:ABC transporter ATP-binding protein [Pseudonocardia sp. TRM90224]
MSELELRGVEVTYRRDGRAVRAVDGVDLSVAPGEVVGLVGESGCGKSSLARAAVGLLAPSAGEVLLDGHAVAPLRRRARPAAQRRLQLVFQDPYSSLNPRRRVGRQLSDAVRLATGTTAGSARVAELLELVGLDPAMAQRYPHELSGGQRQRIAVARALAAEPVQLVADEPISALDASAQAQVADLFVTLARKLGIGVLFISHDLAIVREIADRIAVMYLGRVVEIGPTAQVWDRPRHPYTAALTAAVPRADGAGTLPQDLPGDVPDPAAPPSGCHFHPRCPLAIDDCSTRDPRLLDLTPDHAAACILLEDEPAVPGR